MTKKLMGDEIEALVSHILSLAAVFTAASANSVKIFLFIMSFFLLKACISTYEAAVWEQSNKGY